MQRFFGLNKLLLRQSAVVIESGGSSYDALLRPSLRSLESVPSFHVLRQSFQQRSARSTNFSSGLCNLFFVRRIFGGRASVTTAGITSHFAVGPQSLKFSFLQRKGFGAWQPYGFRRTYWRNVPTSDEVVFGLIGTNVVVYFLWQFADLSFMKKHFVISLENLRNGNLHTMLTSAFSHAELGHLVTNMVGLFFFGTNISRLFGPAFLLKLYVAGALGGSVFFLLHRIYLESAQPFYRRAHALGASAAVNAIILLDVFLFPKNMYYVNLVIPVPAILMGAFIICSDLWRINKGDDNISGSAHMGGAFVALLAWFAVKKGWF
ncbi:RHOMBOID-like protein 12, mitochondrial isoform X1 [Phalaenopsis equestris]|uniref:RHOMBOID-like protein 12, mitochondrial isoform X1 n=1 Tax=Phalaenopsis equestris TaxID=78828 RepID=UPI0009E3B785|nr:RHOMBOID-like protein 12, mitochondrial isoform X1 [Phalaenopsis equestris]